MSVVHACLERLYVCVVCVCVCVQADDLVTHNGHETLCCTGAEGINYRYGGSNGLRLPEDIAAAVWPPAENNPNGGCVPHTLSLSHTHTYTHTHTHALTLPLLYSPCSLHLLA